MNQVKLSAHPHSSEADSTRRANSELRRTESVRARAACIEEAAVRRQLVALAAPPLVAFILRIAWPADFCKRARVVIGQPMQRKARRAALGAS